MSRVEANTGPQTTTRPLDRTALASLYIMIAIGCQARGSSRDELMQASKYFAAGRKMAFEKMLEDPTVNLVRAFVLLAFYMCGACRRNSAFMYLGVAAKSADILGLHAAAQHKRMSKEERDTRLVYCCTRLMEAFGLTQIIKTESGKKRPSLRHYLLLDSGATKQRSLVEICGCHFW